MKYLRYKIVNILDASVHTHTHTNARTHTHTHSVYIVFNNIFIEVFGNNFYLSMECVTLCVTIHGYNTPKK